jgi:hypothetical protein
MGRVFRIDVLALVLCHQIVFIQCVLDLNVQPVAFVLDKEPWFDSSTGSSLAAAHGAGS